MIGNVILGLVSIICFAISAMQFKEKGFLFNNTYIYGSEEERKKMDKTPYYRQSGVVFLLIGIIFAINAVELQIKTGRLFYAVIVVAVITIIFAIASTVRIGMK